MAADITQLRNRQAHNLKSRRLKLRVIREIVYLSHYLVSRSINYRRTKHCIQKILRLQLMT